MRLHCISSYHGSVTCFPGRSHHCSFVILLHCQAYEEANGGDFSTIHELQALFERPYDEQPDMEAKYYRKAPADTYTGVGKGGTAFMS